MFRTFFKSLFDMWKDNDLHKNLLLEIYPYHVEQDN